MINNTDTTTLDNLIKGLIALGEPISKIRSSCPQRGERHGVETLSEAKRVVA